MSSLSQRLRTPALVKLTLLGLLAVNLGLSVAGGFPFLWVAQLAVVTVMVAVVVWVSMEVRHEAGLVRLFACLGFFWVGILFALTLIDVLTR